MLESQFVRNQEPHEVSLPEGSHVAKSKSVDGGAPVVRQLIVDSESLEIAQVIVDRKVKLPEPISAPPLNELNLIVEDLEVVEDQPSNARSTLLTMTEVTMVEPEMDFPARLIHLKIENHRVRAELDSLENIFSSGV